jgi:hypothetical protein
MNSSKKRIVDEAMRVFKNTLREKPEGISARDMTPEGFSNLEKALQEVMGAVGCLVETGSWCRFAMRGGAKAWQGQCSTTK